MRFLTTALCAALFAVPALAGAQSYKLGSLSVEQPWSRPPPPQAPAAVYFTLKNSGKRADILLDVSTPAAGSAMLHQSVEKNGMMAMLPAGAGVVLAAGSTVRFKPGGWHVMLMDLKQPLQDGAHFPLTLHFARAGKLTVEVTVAAQAPAP